MTFKVKQNPMRGCRYGKGLIYYYYEYYYYDYYHLFPFKGCIQRIQNPLSLSFLFESLATHASVKITVLIYILSIFFFFSVLYQYFNGLFHAMSRHIHRPISGLIFAYFIYRIHASHSRENCFILPSVILYCSVILIYDKIQFSLAAVCLSGPCKNCSVKLTDVSAFNSLL